LTRYRVLRDTPPVPPPDTMSIPTKGL
jgi:hypothetical protein